MRKRAAFCCVILISAVRLAYAQPVSSSELIKNAGQHDNKSVVYAGEVIGDVMARGGFAWINLNDGNSAIGVWVDKTLSCDIQYTGGYKVKGDWVEVAGIFHRACVEHGGDLDIHAQSLRKVIPGRVLKERLNLEKRNFALILLGILCLILISKLFKVRLKQK